MHLLGQGKKLYFNHPTYAFFPATEICAELFCQSTWDIFLAKFEPWMKNLSVLHIKQQYIFKLILIRGITLFSTGISSQIPCFIDGLLLYVAYLSSGFGNSKMVTECEPKPISMNFGSPRRGEGGVHVWKAWCRIGLARRKRQF